MDQVPAPVRKSKSPSSKASHASMDFDTQTEVAEDFTDPRATAQAIRAANARQVSGRKRLVDPTTCERDYSREELEFMQAMTAYKHSSGRMFPTWSEVLEVLVNLGYQKVAEPAPREDGSVDRREPNRRR